MSQVQASLIGQPQCLKCGSDQALDFSQLCFQCRLNLPSKTFAPEPPPTILPLDETREILNERGKRYGPYKDNAQISQDLKNVVRRYTQATKFKAYHLEALDMILHKVARICNGEPDYDDNWKDIAGYAQLVVDEIRVQPEQEKLCEN